MEPIINTFLQSSVQNGRIPKKEIVDITADFIDDNVLDEDYKLTVYYQDKNR